MKLNYLLAAAAWAALAAGTAGCGHKEPLLPKDRSVTSTAVAPTVNIVNTDEVTLVEQMARARMEYKTYLEALYNFYVSKGMYDKQVWAEKELADLKKARQYRYLVVADVPSPQMTKPTSKVAEADELYQDAMNYFKHLPVPLLYDEGKMRIALDKFDRIIRDYPQSDKVDDAFFYAGEILKEYFQENEKAVLYYQRAYQADPQTPHPARFQRAVVLDFRLHRRDEALKEYNAVIEFESNRGTFWSKSNADFAATRIRQLTGQ